MSDNGRIYVTYRWIIGISLSLVLACAAYAGYVESHFVRQRELDRVLTAIDGLRQELREYARKK